MTLAELGPTVKPSSLPASLRGEGVRVSDMDAEARLNVHEAVCAERYNGISNRLARLEGILLAACGAIIVALATIAWRVAGS